MAISRLIYEYNVLFGGGYTLLPGTERYFAFFQQDVNASAATYNGVAMTLLVNPIYTHQVQGWGLAIPNSWSGGYPLVITGGGSRIHSMLFAQVDPLSPVLDTQIDGSSSSGSTSASVSIQSLSGGWVEGMIDLATAPVKNANMTNDTLAATLAISRYTTPVDGPVTFSYTFPGSRNAMGVFSLNPYIPGPVNVNSWDGLVMTSVEKLNALVKANIKTINGLG